MFVVYFHSAIRDGLLSNDDQWKWIGVEKIDGTWQYIDGTTTSFHWASTINDGKCGAAFRFDNDLLTYDANCVTNARRFICEYRC